MLGAAEVDRRRRCEIKEAVDEGRDEALRVGAAVRAAIHSISARAASVDPPHSSTVRTKPRTPFGRA